MKQNILIICFVNLFLTSCNGQDKKTDNSTTENYWENIKGFLIDGKNYNTWGINGDKSNKILQQLNQNKNWNIQQIRQVLIENKDNIISVRDYEVYFYKNEKLSLLYLGSNYYSRFEELKTFSSDDIINKEDFYNCNRIDYFQKISKVKYEEGGSGMSQSFISTGYIGNWFTSLYFENEKLKIKFKDVVLGVEDEGKSNCSFSSLYEDGNGFIDTNFVVSYYQFNNNFGIIYVSRPQAYYIIERK